jgi:BirA family biotin operon repressor/biotin-[acetyl-CoA-carboxylase] ligase
MIFTQLIQTNLRTKELGKNIEYYNRLDSTNTEAWELVEENKNHGTIVITENQTNGKGQKNKTWGMVPGKSLVFSLILTKNYPIDHSGLICLTVSLALIESLNKRGLDAQLKWPNDLLIDGKKIGGILCETKIEKNDIKNMVIGVGVNVNESIAEHDESIQKNLTTMFEVSKHPHQRELIVAEFINSFELMLNKLSTEPNQIIEEWLDKCMHLNERILFLQNDKILEGVFCGLDNNGFAKIEIDNKVKSYNSINLI